ncbi:MAG: hypothetical protein EBR62_01775 [Verrucomicrobia bacterium]|jgi:hypothetical protein|nr:hypothetical protein [Verrucomicrobiota bacterium]
MAAVKLQKESNPVVTLLSLMGITLITLIVMYAGLPGTGFHGIKAGVYFDMESGFEDARFMDNRIVCDSKDALKDIRAALLAVKPDYPVDRVTLSLENYASGYKFKVRYVTYYAQRLNLFEQGKLFRRGSEVGDPALDAEVKAKDDELEGAIRKSLETYFKSKGAQ